MKKYLKWCLPAFLLLAAISVSIAAMQPWDTASADETLPISITKMWDDADNADGSRPDSVRMQINKNGEPWQTVELTAEDEWTLDVYDAPLRDADGNKYEYTLTEELPDGYSSMIVRSDPEDVTMFTAEITPSENCPYTGEEFTYAITVVNDSTYSGKLNVEAVLDKKVSVLGTTDSGIVDGNTVRWEGLDIAADGTKILYVTASASESGSLSARATATINGKSIIGACNHEAQRCPEITVFTMEAEEQDDAILGSPVMAVFKITIDGEAGAAYEIETDGTLVGGSLTGVLDGMSETYIYVTNITIPSSTGWRQVDCRATLSAGPRTAIGSEIPDTVTTASAYIRVIEPVGETITVTWKNEDGTLLNSKMIFKGSDLPSYSVIPTKESSSTHTFIFREWVQSTDEAGNITFTASYDAIERPENVSYDVICYDNNGSQLKKTTRTGTVGETVSVSASDKVLFNYFFNASDARNITSKRLEESGTVLKLYFTQFADYNDSEELVFVKTGDRSYQAIRTLRIQNVSGMNCYGLTLYQTVAPIKGITMKFHDFEVNGAAVTPVTGGEYDMMHVISVLSRNSVFAPNSIMTVTCVIDLTLDKSFSGDLKITENYNSVTNASPEFMSTASLMYMSRAAVNAKTVKNEPIRFLVTNTHVAEQPVTVNAIWNDGNDADHMRPDSVQVAVRPHTDLFNCNCGWQTGSYGNMVAHLQNHLINNEHYSYNSSSREEDTKYITLSGNSWSGTEKFPLWATDSVPFQYEVSMPDVPNGYSCEVTGSGSDFTITLSHEAQSVPVLQEYTVSYDLNGGYLEDEPSGFERSGSTYSAIALEGQSTPVLGITPKKDHYEFAGWSPSLSDTVYGNAVYTAEWEKTEYTVTYVDGSGSILYTGHGCYGDPTPAFPGVPERDGYVFKGWEPATADILTDNATYAAIWELAAPEVHVHMQGNETIIKEPTCTEQGINALVCSSCGETYGEYAVPATGHTEGAEETVTEPSCTEPGMARSVCTACGTVCSERPIPATGHTEGSEAVIKEPSCTEEGMSGYTCSACGAIYDEHPIPATGHTRGTATAITAPTCTEPGISGYECSACGTVYDEHTVPAIGHTRGTETVITAPTCTEPGTNGYECSTCGTVYDEHTIPATGHTKGSEKITKEPTCTEEGTAANVCSICGAAYGEHAVVAAGHSSEYTYKDNSDGTHDKMCKACGSTLETETHSYGAWHDAGDMLERECGLCGAPETSKKDVPMHAVQYDAGDGRFAGTASQESPEGSAIVVAEAAVPGSKFMHFAGWSYGGRVYEPGSRITVNSDITFTAVYEAHDLEEDYHAPTCESGGWSQNVCRVCGYKTEMVPIAKLVHLMSCTDICKTGMDDGCRNHEWKCTICGHTETSPHSYGNWAADVKDGQVTAERSCTVCGHKQYVKTPESCSTTYNGRQRPITNTGFGLVETNLDGYSMDVSYTDENGLAVDGSPKDAGLYTARISLTSGNSTYAADIDYEIQPAVLTVSYVSETISISSMTRFKGTVSVDGFMHDDVGMPDFDFPDIDTDSVNWNEAGSYTLTPYGGSVNSNYVFRYVPGTLTIVDDGSASVTYHMLEEDPTKPLAFKTDILQAGTRAVIDLDGGRWSDSTGFWEGTSGTYEHTLKNGDKATLGSIPTKDGYLFMGWKKATRGTTVTYTAHWGEITVKALSDKTYNGTGQAPVIEVSIHGDVVGTGQYAVTGYRNADGTSLGTDSNGEPVLPKDAGRYTVEIAVKDPLGTKVQDMETGYIIKPAKLTVRTENAKKPYDGEPLTAGGELTGLMGSDDAVLNITGSQTEKGSSTNTYEIIWGSTKASNYEVAECLGTLTIKGAENTNPDDGNNQGGNTKPDNSQGDNIKPDDSQSGDTKPDDNKPDDNKPDNSQGDNIKPDNNKHDDNQSGNTKPGEGIGVLEVNTSVHWSDVRDYDGLRPEYVNIDLYQDGQLYLTGTASADNEWHYTFRVDKADKNGREYEYTVNAKVPDKYEAATDGYEITLKHVPLTSMTVTIYWNDKNNKDRVRPDEAELVIYQNGKAFRTVKALKKDGWKLTVNDLPKFDADYAEYEYSLGYDKVPDGYRAALDGLSITYAHEVNATQATAKPSSEDGSTTTTQKPSATLKPGRNDTADEKPSSTEKPSSGSADPGNTPDKNKGEVVKTGENDFLFLGILGLAALSGGTYAIYWNKKKRH